MNYKVVRDLSPNDLVSLRESVLWKPISIEQASKGLLHTMCKVSVFVDDNLVAGGRLVGDYSCKGVLSDIIVNPNYQKKGYGKVVVTELIKMVEEMLSPGERFQIEATPTMGNRDFYVKCGMKYKPTNQDGVYMWIEK